MFSFALPDILGEKGVLMLRCAITTFVFVVCVGCSLLVAAEPHSAFQSFVQKQGLKLRENDSPPTSIGEWNERRLKLRENLLNAWGGFPASHCDLAPRKLGEFQREGYRVEKIVFQTRPGVWMTANAYVPDKPGRLPAILHVHGHWKGAKQDPTVQKRCIGSAKAGFFVLCVDAFGAGERAIQKKLGEYHGEMTAATLLPIGLPLAGLQVYENMRAVDYLMSRPEVDPQQIGVTGASGGGNQSMYVGAYDERLRCVVPTCSVGTYQSYLSAACCLCELIPGGLRFTEEGDILGLAANRGLMVTSATKDAFQFSVDEAKKSLARAEVIGKLYADSSIRHTIVESPHDYNQQMREAMYGWMTRNLKHEGDGAPIAESEIQTEDPETLCCFPGESRPDDFVTIPEFAYAEALKIKAARKEPSDRATLDADREQKRQKLVKLLGGFPDASPLNLQVASDADTKAETLTYESEPGISLVSLRDMSSDRPARIALLLDLDAGADAARSSDLAKRLREEGWSVVAAELRATGRLAVRGDQIGAAADHNSAEWSIWIGRPLLGQWVHDVRRTLDAITERDGALPKEVLVVGRRSSALVGLCAAAFDERISQVQAIDALATYLTNRPYREVRLGVIVPGIYRDFGDVADLAVLVAPRSVAIRGGMSGAGQPFDLQSLKLHYATAAKAFELLGAANAFSVDVAQ